MTSKEELSMKCELDQHLLSGGKRCPPKEILPSSSDAHECNHFKKGFRLQSELDTHMQFSLKCNSDKPLFLPTKAGGFCMKTFVMKNGYNKHILTHKNN